MPDRLIITPRVAIPVDELRFAFARSSGPGGQNVNKVASKVELRWTPGDSTALGPDDRAWLLAKLGGRLTTEGELIVVSEKTRDQLVNRGDATDKLVAIVRAALVRPKPRKATKPSRRAKERRLGAKKRRADVKSGRGRVSD
ncbi:MAG TPA: alternative ribosome rescue aminoacyl-tRNA hydrolase ArfB [Kofleriaceae bacterium]|nr:alternative ribosome rescue aminoacyl-tRNA hydrolase ArfB [Kofleriaceae bacterium]